MKELVDLEEQLLRHKGGAPPAELLEQAKKAGSADRYLSRILGIPERDVRQQRLVLGVSQAWDGGRTPLSIARELHEARLTVLGTTPETIDLAENRERSREVMTGLAIPMPASGIARSPEDALTIVEEIGYPVIVRPS